MLPIKNTSMLQNTGDPLVRGPLLRMANHALAALNSERLIPSLVRLEGDILHVGDTVWNLADYRRVLVVGAGKAGVALTRHLATVNFGNHVHRNFHRDTPVFSLSHCQTA